MNKLVKQNNILDYTSLIFSDTNSWSLLKNNNQLNMIYTSSEQLHIVCNLDKDDQNYIISESGSFQNPPTDTKKYSVLPNTSYEISTVLKTLTKLPNVQLWIIEYSDEKRLAHSNIILKEGNNILEFTSSPETTCYKIAFRFSGKGEIEIDPIKFVEIKKDEIKFGAKLKTLKRERTLPPLSKYQGENLVFIVGAPRSGTTWLLNLFSEKQNVIAATEDNLDAKINPRPTLETNIFNKNRPFTDAEIKEKFYMLSKKNPNKVIVEKTPVHLLYTKRQKKIFPKSVIVFIERDGRDVVTSLLNVGRDPNAWWKGAPKTIEKAILFWKQYADAARESKKGDISYILRYEELLKNTETELNNIYSKLGLPSSIKEQIIACDKGKKIPIKGVFREGKSEGWKRYFTKKEIEVFKKMAGDLLIESGYEKDNSWNVST